MILLSTGIYLQGQHVNLASFPGLPSTAPDFDRLQYAKTEPDSIFLHTATVQNLGQKLELGKAWERGYVNRVFSYWRSATALVCKNCYNKHQ